MSTNNTEHLQNAEKVIRHLADPKALYLTLIHRWKWIVVCTVLGVIVGCVVIKLTQKKFESTGKLLVHQKLPTFMDDSERLPDAKAYDSLFATHLQLIGSSMMIEKAIEQHRLDELPEITDCLEEDETVADYIRKHLKVKRAGSGDSAGAFVIQLGFGHISAKECPEVVDALLKVYKNYLDQNSMDNQTSAVDLLTSLQKNLENDIIKKGQKFRDFIRSSPGVWDPDTLRNNHQRKISLLEEELTELEIRRTATASRIQIMDGAKAKGLPALDRLALVEEHHVPRLEMLASIKVEGVAEFFQLMYPERQEFASAKYDDLLNLFVEKTTLLGNLGPDHPRIQDLESDIRALESKLNENESKFLGPNVKSQLQPDDLVQAYESFLKLEQGDLALRILAIQKEIKSQFADSNVLLDYSFEANRLKDEYSRSTELHDVLVDKMQKQKLISEFGTYTTQVIQRPQKGECTWPNKPVMLALFTMLGGFTGILLAILLDLLAFVPTLGFGTIGFWRGLTDSISWRRKNAF